MPDVTGKRVQIVGDSLSASSVAPGGWLAGNLVGAAEVKINAKVGRSAISFYANEDGASQLAAIRAFDPDVAIVVLGTNDIGRSATADRAAMDRLRAELAAGGAEVWAFGPPAFADPARTQGATLVYQTMRQVFGGHLLDARDLTADLTGAVARTADGVHFTAASGKVAGTRMAQRFLGTAEGPGIWWVLLAAAVGGYYLLR